jgi:hypothetical protein
VDESKVVNPRRVGSTFECHVPRYSFGVTKLSEALVPTPNFAKTLPHRRQIVIHQVKNGNSSVLEMLLIVSRLMVISGLAVAHGKS